MDSQVAVSSSLPGYMQHITSFLHVLGLTRRSCFLQWTSSSAQKAFKWSAVVAQLTAEIENEYHSNAHFRIEIEKLDIKNCEFLSSVIVALSSPVQVMQRAMLSSPLLPWCLNAADIVDVCLKTTGNSDVNNIASVIQDSLVQQHRYFHISKLLQSSHPECHGTDLCGLVVADMSVKLLLTLCNVTDIKSAYSPSCYVYELPAEVHSLLYDICLKDVVRWYCSSISPFSTIICALLLPPGEILSHQVVLQANCSPSSTYGLERRIILMSKSPSLWNLVEKISRENIDYVLNTFKIFQSMPSSAYKFILTVERLTRVSPTSLSTYIYRHMTNIDQLKPCI